MIAMNNGADIHAINDLAVIWASRKWSFGCG